jgi:hypothetical protein
LQKNRRTSGLSRKCAVTLPHGVTSHYRHRNPRRPATPDLTVRSRHLSRDSVTWRARSPTAVPSRIGRQSAS